MRAAPTLAQIRLYVEQLLEKGSRSRIVGIKAPSVESHGRFSIKGQEFDVLHSDSVLQIYDVVSQHEQAGQGCVVLTNLADAELGSDLLARMARQRLHIINDWELLKNAFAASKIDPQLSKQHWIARELLQIIPADGFPRVATGILDADTAWTILLRDKLGLDQPRPDAADLLVWSHDPENLRRYAQASEELREGFLSRASAVGGPVADAIVGCVQAGCGGDALSLGLVLDVLFHQQAPDDPQLREAAVRLESYCAGRQLTAQPARSWAAAARQILGRVAALGWPAQGRDVIQRSQEILAAIRAEAFAYLSDVLGSGFEQRLERYGAALSAALAGSIAEWVGELEVLAQAVAAHERGDSDRKRRVEMSLRLVRWLQQVDGETRPASSLGESAGRYAQDGGFVDWARSALAGGDACATFEAGLRKLLSRVRDLRELQNREFAQLLVRWAAVHSDPAPLMPVEQVLDRVVAPVARQAPVLLVVMDGMSFAVFRELIGSLERQGWELQQPQGGPPCEIGVATFPTVTQFSRTSLLCGRLTGGTAADEAAGFAAHPGLREASQGSHPPILFHKYQVTEMPGQDLASGLRRELEEPKRRVVGVVINAIDDYLAKGDQIYPRWETGYITVLPALLSCAAQARRAVILASDHGHVIDRETTLRNHDDAQRYRREDGDPQPDECTIAGPRVLGFEDQRLIAPWSEFVRYGMKQNGYHGGLTPQEVLAPLAVLVHGSRVLKGWEGISSYVPAWWEHLPAMAAPEGPGMQPSEVKRPSPAASTRKKTAATPKVMTDEQPLLFDAPPAGETASNADWISRLLSSEVFAAQKVLAGRHVPSNEVVGQFLTELSTRGGKLTTPALARLLNLSVMRMSGLVAKMRQLFNVDGYEIVTRDDASDSILLDKHLLIKQFEIEL